MSSVSEQITDLSILHGDLLCRMSTGGDHELLRRMVTTLGLARAEGHVCVDLKVWVDEKLDRDDPPRPSLESLRKELLATGVVGVGKGPLLPLVLDSSNRLYALRHFQAEQRIANFVAERLQRKVAVTAKQLSDTLAAVDLVPSKDTARHDWQLAAVVAGCSRALTVICGGPGTGKTTTVAKLLSALLHNNPNLRIAIAAPTGKAAARLGEALQERSATQPNLAEPLANLNPRTLHRLLGYLPANDAFRYGASKCLPYDVVVVDEVSMVDPAIFAVLCDALAEDTRLVLVGDKDQLAAVAAGQVLGDLCEAAKPELGPGEQLAGYIKEATGMDLPVQANASLIANATIALWTNYRFGSQPGIGAFAQALMRRDPKVALAAFSLGHDDLVLTDNVKVGLSKIEPELLKLLDAAATNDPGLALAAVTHARILTAQRLGPLGALRWNRRVEERLMELGYRTDDTYYVGRPILITSNDQGNRIWNGDLGVCGRNQDGETVVWIMDPNGSARELNPRRLPAHETAWAMTVHKAQGSEFDHVLLSLPDRPTPLNNASLIYTGVTRAKRRATICANLELLEEGLANWPERKSGLAATLR